MFTILLGILEEGLVYAIMTLGVYITYKILDFPDLSVDGTFPLGAAITAAVRPSTRRGRPTPRRTSSGSARFPRSQGTW